MASDRPHGTVSANLDNVRKLPLPPRLPSNLTSGAESGPKPLAIVRQLFPSKDQRATSRVSSFAEFEDMHSAVTRHAVGVVLARPSILTDMTDQEPFRKELARRLLLLRQELMTADPELFTKAPHIKEIKHKVLVDIVTTLAQLGKLKKIPVLNLNNYQTSISEIKQPVEDARFNVFSFYKSLFQENGGIISGKSFQKLNRFFRDEYWMSLKNAAKKSPEFRALQALVGDELETNFLSFTSLERLLSDNEDPLLAAWSQHRSVVDFMVAAMKARPISARTQGIREQVLSLREKLRREIEKHSGSSSSQSANYKVRKELLDEVEQSTEYVRTFIQGDIMQIKDPSNVKMLWSTRIDQLGNEEEIVAKIQQSLQKLKVEDLQTFRKVFVNMLKFLMDDPIKRTATYKSLARWPDEMVADFADWLYEALAYQDISRVSNRDEFRAQIVRVLSPKKR